MNKLLLLLTFGVFVVSTHAQEFNAAITVNHSKVQGNTELFRNLEEQLRIFINDRKWSETDFQHNERVDCSFTVIINEMLSPNSFNAELLVQAQRPVFNATYKTVLLNFRDTDFSFDYYGYQPLEIASNRVSDNLSATIAFYVYLILGLDFDSMSPLGGTPYFQNARALVNNIQSNGWKGWEAYGNNRNRYAIMQAFSDPSFESYRKMWYDYHRLGLDLMADNPDEAKAPVIGSIEVIDDLYARQPSSALITLFGEAKLYELVSICAKATPDERRKAYETLRKIYPTRPFETDKLR